VAAAGRIYTFKIERCRLRFDIVGRLAQRIERLPHTEIQPIRADPHYTSKFLFQLKTLINETVCSDHQPQTAPGHGDQGNHALA